MGHGAGPVKVLQGIRLARRAPEWYSRFEITSATQALRKSVHHAAQTSHTGATWLASGMGAVALRGAGERRRALYDLAAKKPVSVQSLFPTEQCVGHLPHLFWRNRCRCPTIGCLASAL